MCTVSVIPPLPGRGLRVMVNRDERLTRSAAWAPQLAHHGRVQVISPVDSETLGTWVAASSTGLVYALLNHNEAGGVTPRTGKTSRGHILPLLAGSSDYDDANRRVGALDVDRFAPFRILIVDGTAAAVCTWNGFRVVRSSEVLQRPIIATSSSLGDDLVEAPRQTLFEDLLAQESDPWRAQERLHQHAWPDRRHLSVLMSRTTARTVSRTAVVIDPCVVTMTYAPVIDGWIGPVTEARLTRGTLPLALAG